jgi:hypothetical protein
VEKKKWPWPVIVLLALSPCLLCGLSVELYGLVRGRLVAEQRKLGDAYISELEAGKKPPLPEHFHLDTFDDGGYRVYFSEPGRDFYSVWNPQRREWETVEDVELFK